MAHQDELAERLAALEARVARLEGGADPDVFWALTELRGRMEDQAGQVLYTGSVRLPGGEHYEWQRGASTERLLGLDWPESADRIAALGNPVRLLLVQQVISGVTTVAELQRLPGVGTTGQVYHHLRQLVAAGWLQSVARGRYAVPGEKVVPLLVLLAIADG